PSTASKADLRAAAKCRFYTAASPQSGAWLFRILVQGFDQNLGGRTGRGRVLAGDQLAVGDRVNASVLDLGKGGAEAHQFVLDEEGNHLRQAHLFLLTIGEAGHVLALDERLAFRGRDMAQRAGSVAHKRNGFAGSDKRFDQLD